MATINDVANCAGVSPTTVSRDLARKLSARPEIVARIRSAATVLHSHPSALAQGLITRRMGTIAMVVADITDLVYPLAIRGIVDVTGSTTCIAQIHISAAMRSPTINLSTR